MTLILNPFNPKFTFLCSRPCFSTFSCSSPTSLQNLFADHPICLSHYPSFNNFTILIIAMLLPVDQYHISISSSTYSDCTCFSAFLSSITFLNALCLSVSYLVPRILRWPKLIFSRLFLHIDSKFINLTIAFFHQPSPTKKLTNGSKLPPTKKSPNQEFKFSHNLISTHHSNCSLDYIFICIVFN